MNLAMELSLRGHRFGTVCGVSGWCMLIVTAAWPRKLVISVTCELLPLLKRLILSRLCVKELHWTGAGILSSITNGANELASTVRDNSDS